MRFPLDEFVCVYCGKIGILMYKSFVFCTCPMSKKLWKEKRYLMLQGSDAEISKGKNDEYANIQENHT